MKERKLSGEEKCEECAYLCSFVAYGCVMAA